MSGERAEQRAGIKIDGDASGIKAASNESVQALQKITDAAAGSQGMAQATDKAAASTKQLTAELTKTVTAQTADTAAKRTVTEATTAVTAATGGLGKAAADADTAIKRTTSSTTAHAAAAKAATKTTTDLGISQGQLSAAMRTLPAQFTDIFTSLAAGQNPLQVFLQQGGQIKDSFGGTSNAARVLLGMLTPLNVAIGASAVVLGGVALAAYQGVRDTSELTKQLALMGDTASYSRGQVDQLITSLADRTGQAVGGIREVTMELLKVPALGGAALADAQRAALALQRLTGQSAAEATQQLAVLSSNVVDGAAKLNKAYGFMTAAQFEQVQSLAAQGRSVEAVKLVLGELADTMEQRSGPAMGFLDRQIEEHNAIWSKLWATLKGIGAETSAEERLAAMQVRLQANRQAAEHGNFFSSFFLPDLEAEEEQFRNLLNRDAIRAAERRAAQAGEQTKIEEMSSAHQAALASIDKAGEAVRLAQAGVDFARRQAALELSFQRGETSARAYQVALLNLDRGRIDEQIRNIDRLAQIEAARKPSSPNDELAQQAALKQLEAQRLALQQQRVRLLSDEKRGLRDIAPPATNIGPTDALRRFQATDNSNVDRYVTEQRLARDAAAADLVSTNQRLSVSLIQNVRERGLAEISLEEEVLRKRLDLQALSADDQKRVGEDLAAWRLNRERQLTEELKPEWQRQVEAWRDTTQLMQDSFDRSVLAAINEGEAAWIKFAQTGKLSVKSLGDAIVAETARAGYRQFVSLAAQLIGSYFNADSGIVSGGSSESSSGDYIRGRRKAGGLVGSGGAYWVGEDGPELLRMGSRSGWVEPNEAVTGGGGGWGALPDIKVINATGVQADATVRRGGDGGIEVLLSAMEDRMADRVSNGQGSLYSSFRGRFGVRDTFSSA